MLKEVTLDSHGVILRLETLSGTEINTNGKNLISSNEPREIARWKSAFAELVDEGLLVGRNYKGEIFEVTDLGYQIADMIQF